MKSRRREALVYYTPIGPLDLGVLVSLQKKMSKTLTLMEVKKLGKEVSVKNARDFPIMIINHTLLYIMYIYRVFIRYCVFSLKCCDFSEFCQFCCSAGVLPAWCVYPH